jgi:hypothetical protein
MGAPTCVHVECSTYMTYMKLDMYPTVALNNYEPYFNISTSLQTIDRTTRQIVHNTQEASHLVHLHVCTFKTIGIYLYVHVVRSIVCREVVCMHTQYIHVHIYI